VKASILLQCGKVEREVAARCVCLGSGERDVQINRMGRQQSVQVDLSLSRVA
jgi:hypothetical protein